MEKKKRTRTIAALAAIVLLAAAAAGTFWFFHREIRVREIHAEKLIFADDALELKAGDSQCLRYSVYPVDTTDKTVTWKSSDPSVAKVDGGGNVTAVNEGEAVISAVTVNGKVDECLVTVTPTAFDYLKKLALSSENGYTVGSYIGSTGGQTDIGFVYDSSRDSICLMDDYWRNYREISLASLFIPKSVSEDYIGTLEYHDGYVDVHASFKIDAPDLKSDTRIKSQTCDSDSFRVAEFEEVYSSCVRAMLSKLYSEVLEPNGFTYAYIGFDSFNI